MPFRANGGRIGPRFTPSASAASGVWSTTEQYKWRKNNTWPGIAAVATGGTVVTSGGYKIHTFTSSGTFTVSSGSLLADTLVIGGGGSGGTCSGNGAGAGGLIQVPGMPMTPGSYPVSIGGGGSPINGTSGIPGNQGNPTTFNGLEALGGGFGGYTCGGTSGGTGGSGGGGGSATGLQPSRPGQSGSPFGRGNPGSANDPGPGAGVGGGGAGGAGAATFGGSGFASSYSGSPVIYAAGGGPSNVSGAPGGANTGGGGAGMYGTGPSGAGGSGLVIIRYPDV